MIKKIRNVLVILLIVALLISPLFIHVKVECKSQSGDCPPEITSKLSVIKNRNLFETKREATKILKNNYLVSDYSLQFKLPDILLINTIVKKPVFAILDKSTNNYYLLDENGSAIAASDKSNFPTLIKDSIQMKPGEKASDSDIFSLKLIQGVWQMYQIPTGEIQNDSLVVDLKNGIRVIFPIKDAEIDVLLGSLRLIYNKITTDYPGMYSQIDMRYKNPILR